MNWRDCFGMYTSPLPRGAAGARFFEGDPRDQKLARCASPCRRASTASFACATAPSNCSTSRFALTLRLPARARAAELGGEHAITHHVLPPRDSGRVRGEASRSAPPAEVPTLL
jgi:hypothetical protein